MRRKAILLTAALLSVLASAAPVRGTTCADSSTVIWFTNSTTRLDGNHVQGFGQTSITGNYYWLWQLYLSSWWYFNSSLVLSYQNEAGPYLGASIGRYHTTTLQSSGPGTFSLTTYHSGYAAACYQSAPPYWNGATGWVYGAPFAVQRPTISGYGLTGVWWLGGGADPNNGYYNAIALHADPKGAPETPYWSVPVNPQKVSLSCSACVDNAAYSRQPSNGCVNDVTVKISVAGFESNPFQFIVNAPSNLFRDSVTFHYPVGDHGYRSDVGYHTLDLCGYWMTTVANNEVFASWTNYGLGGWFPPPSQGYSGFINVDPVDPRHWFDSIWANSGPSWIPQTQNPHGGTELVMFGSQTWRFGSATVGAGVPVQNATMYFYRDHGEVR